MITFLPYLSDGGWWLVVDFIMTIWWLLEVMLVVLLFGQLDNQTTVISSACGQPGLSCIVPWCGPGIGSGILGIFRLVPKSVVSKSGFRKAAPPLKEKPTKPTKPMFH